DSVRVYDLGDDGTPLGCRAAYPAGHDPIAVSVSADGSTAYIVSRRDRLVTVIDPIARNEACGVTDDSILREGPAGSGALLEGGDVQVFGHFTAPAVGPRCGDGIVQPPEQCDDNNTLDGDCCSATCMFEPAGSPCPDDGAACTVDVCDAKATCTHVPGNE